MKIETGKLYHIKDEFFEIMNDENLMTNHEKGRTRPTYLAIKEKDVLWFIPLSTQVSKYKKIVEYKYKKYGSCSGIIINKIADRNVAILIQNAFPTLEKYIDHEHIVKGNIITFPKALTAEILGNFKNMLRLKERGNNLFFTDIDGIKRKLEKELSLQNN